jgi:hypothetical protein
MNNMFESQMITFMGSHGKWDDYDISFTITVTIKHGRFKRIEHMNKRHELYDVSTCNTFFLKYDPF